MGKKHDLRDLYTAVIQTNSEYKNDEVEAPVEKFWNYDEAARYKSAGTKQRPTNNSMGTANLVALDKAVAVLRDLSVVTRKGLDRIVSGENDFTKNGVSDPHLALHSVILFHNNDAFKPKKSDILKQVDFKPPLFT